MHADTDTDIMGYGTWAELVKRFGITDTQKLFDPYLFSWQFMVELNIF